jgi:hypothetical protein
MIATLYQLRLCGSFPVDLFFTENHVLKLSVGQKEIACYTGVPSENETYVQVLLLRFSSFLYLFCFCRLF